MGIIEKEFEYHYIFGVRIENTGLRDRGKLSLDFMIDYDSNDIENLMLAMDMINNEIIKSTRKEAIEAFGLSSLCASLNASVYMKNANNLSVHHLTTTCEMTREDLGIWVDCCNHDNTSLRKLEDSQIRY